MMDCRGCAYSQECIKNCVDCFCASCIRHGANGDCCLGAVIDWYVPDEEEEEHGHHT